MKTRMGLLIVATLAVATGHSVAKPIDAKPPKPATPFDATPLVEIAKRYQLPMPPDDARLVLAHTKTTSCLGNKSTSRDPGIYSPAFLLKEESSGNIEILRGAERETLQAQGNRGPLWRPFSTAEVTPKLGGHVSDFSRMSAFVCAVQTAAHGDTDTAQAIWRRFSGAGWWRDGYRFHEDIPSQLGDQHLLLGRCIFDHLRNALLQPGNQRAEIHGSMSALLKEFPQLNADWRRELFEDLTTTVNAPPPKAGSVEALLLDWASRPSNMRHLGMYVEQTQTADAPAREILARGLAAVPELIALLNDRRVTVHEQPAFMNGAERIRSVGELARQLVREIAGQPGPFPPSFPQRADDTAKILAWWKRAQTRDESAVLMEGAFRREGRKITGVNEGPVRILAEKFPEKLPVLCEEFTSHAAADAHPSALAKAIADSKLPQETRVQVLSNFAKRGSLEHKRCVLQNLAKLDQQACSALLLPLLGKLPKDATGPYWTCPEASFAHVIVQIEDDKVWRAYLGAAKRSRIGLRMELMNPMDYSYIGKKNLPRRLAFLAAFLDDKAVRKLSGEEGKFQGPCAGFTIPRLAVRDLAAMELASLLEMKESPDEFWTHDQWGELRRKVAEHLKDQKLPELCGE